MASNPRDALSITEGIGTTGDVLAPVFQVYISRSLDVVHHRAAAILVDRDAVLDVRAAAEGLVADGTLVPLAGPWADDKGQTNDVTSVTFEESIEDNFPLASVRVTLHNVYDDVQQSYRYTDLQGHDKAPPIVEYGRTVVLRMGYPHDGNLDRVQTVFVGIIVSIEASFPADGEPTVEISAVDRRDRVRGARRRRLLSFKAGTSAEQAIADVVAEYGLRVAVTRAQDDAIKQQRSRATLTRSMRLPADQPAQQFIIDLAQKHALELSAFGDVVFVQDPDDVTRHAIRYVYRAGLIAFTPRLNTSGRPTKVTVVSRCSELGTRIQASATPALLREKKLAPAGSSTLDRVISDEKGERELVITNYAVETDDEAEQLAIGIMKRHLDQTFTATGELLGDPRVRVRRTLEIGGTGRWDGAYYVTMARHRFGANGYQTTFNARRNRALEEPSA